MENMLNNIKQGLRLRQGELRRLGTSGGRVVKGEAWVTVPGLFDDLIVKAGDALPCCAEGILLQALSAELVVEETRQEFEFLRQSS